MLFESNKTSRRKPSPAQQRILDQMRAGVWYEPEWRGEDGKCKDRTESCNALVGLGRCIMARIAKEGPDGKLFEPSPEELLLEVIFSGKKHDQPLVMYRLANAETQRPEWYSDAPCSVCDDGIHCGECRNLIVMDAEAGHAVCKVTGNDLQWHDYWLAECETQNAGLDGQRTKDD